MHRSVVDNAKFQGIKWHFGVPVKSVDPVNKFTRADKRQFLKVYFKINNDRPPLVVADGRSTLQMTTLLAHGI